MTDQNPPPWKHPNRATRVTFWVTSAVLLVLAVLLALALVKGIIAGFEWVLSW